MATQRKKITALLLSLDGVMECASIFSKDDADRAFFVDGKQIANFIGGDAMELRLTRKQVSAHRAKLKADPRVTLRSGDWITLRIESAKDVALLAELAPLAVAAHAPLDGAVAKLPPAGAALAKRRRFH